MRTTVIGEFRGRPTRVVVTDGEIVDGRREGAAAAALGAVRAGLEVRIPGVWAGPASLADPTSVCATFAEVLDPGSARFEGDTVDVRSLGVSGAVQ